MKGRLELLLLLLLVTVGIAPSEQRLSSLTYGEDSPLAEAVSVAIFRYASIAWKYRKASLYVGCYYGNMAAHQIQLDVLNEVLFRLQYTLPVEIQTLRMTVEENGKPCVFNLLFIENLVSFGLFLESISERYEISGVFWIVFNVVQKADIQGILYQLWRKKVIFALIFLIDNDSKDSVELYSYYPYRDGLCGVIQPLRLNWERDELIGNRLRNFYGCPLRVGTIDNPPFIKIAHGSRALFGIEGNLINMIAGQLNFSLQIIVSPSESLADVGTKQGLMSMVIDDQVDLALGGFGLSKDLGKYMSPGAVHYDSAVTFAVPTGRPYTSFEKLFFPFSLGLWLVVCGVMTCAVVCIVIVRRQDRAVRDFIFGNTNRTPIMVLTCVLFGVSLSRCPKRNFARTLLMLWILCTMILRTAFQASLYKILQTPKNVSSPTTLLEVYSEGLDLYMSEYSKQYLAISPEMLENIKFVQNDHYLLDTILDQLGEGDLSNGAVLIAVDKIAHYNQVNSKSKFITIIQETVFRYPVAIFYPKNSLLEWVFNIEVLKLRSTGLTELWASRYGNYEFFDQRQRSKAPKQLSLGHLQGIFEIYGALVITSILVFLLEIYSLKGSRPTCGLLFDRR